MQPSFTGLALLLLGGTAVASPLAPRETVVTVTKTAPASASTAYDWSAGAVPDYPIHSSCNSTLRTQLQKALGETVKLAQHAKEHLLRFGDDSSFKQKYFGNGSTAEPIGWYDRIVGADKGGMLFRCDDPDRNCATQSGWAGHWRGSNATQETVICPLSFHNRWPLEALCSRGYTVAQSPLNTFFAVDLMHRILHVPKISEGIVSHYAEDYDEVLELAESSSGNSAKDSDTLQAFAIDVYAYDVAAPGVGCSGEVPEHKHEASSSAQASTPAATATGSAAPASQTPSVTTSAAANCHTHSDGAVHCE